MSSEFEREERAKRDRRRFLAGGAGLLAAMWSTQAQAKGWSWFCTRPKPCFVTGTHVETHTGLVRVDDLLVGDRVRTLDGSFKPIRWIGTTALERPEGAAWSRDVAPIRIARDAIAAGVPRCDLLVSAYHAVWFDGVLVQAKDLVNGRTITVATDYPADTLSYFHVELDAHDVVFAEGTAVETYRALDGNRADFDTATGTASSAVFTAPCAPILTLTRKDRIIVGIKSALLPSRNHLGRLGEIRRQLAVRADRLAQGEKQVLAA